MRQNPLLERPRIRFRSVLGLPRCLLPLALTHLSATLLCRRCSMRWVVPLCSEFGELRSPASAERRHFLVPVGWKANLAVMPRRIL